MSIDAATVAAVIETLAGTPQYAGQFLDLLTLRGRVECAETAAVLEDAEDTAGAAQDDLVLDLVAELRTQRLVAA